jgi:hypothetical protein
MYSCTQDKRLSKDCWLFLRTGAEDLQAQADGTRTRR